MAHGVYSNRFQGEYPRILFVCSGGILRSATASHHFAEKHKWNTRAAGTEEYALIPVNHDLMAWAARVFVMETYHAMVLKRRYPEFGHKIDVLNIPDNFEYRSPELVALLEAKVPEKLVDREPFKEVA